VSVQYGSHVWSKLLITVGEEGKLLGAAGGNYRGAGQTGRCLPGRQSEEVKCNVRTQILGRLERPSQESNAQIAGIPGNQEGEWISCGALMFRWLPSPVALERFRFTDCESLGSMSFFCNCRCTIRMVAKTGTDKKQPVIPPICPPVRTPKITTRGWSSVPALNSWGDKT